MKLLKLEFFKCRRRKILLVYAAVLAAELLWIVSSFLRQDAEDLIQGWMLMLYDLAMVDAIILPISVATIASRNCELEHIVILTILRFRPVGVGGVVEEDDPLQIPAVVRIVRVLGGDLVLQGAAGGDLDLLEVQLDAVHVLGQFLGGEGGLHGLGEQEIAAGGGGHQFVVLDTHVCLPPKNKIYESRAVRRPCLSPG